MFRILGVLLLAPNAKRTLIDKLLKPIVFDGNGLPHLLGRMKEIFPNPSPLET